MNTNSIPQPPTYMPPPQHFHIPTPTSPTEHRTKEKEIGKRIQIAFFVTIAFIVLSNPIAYRFTNQIYTAFTNQLNEILSESGAPSNKGIFLHSIIFFLFAMFLLTSGQK